MTTVYLYTVEDSVTGRVLFVVRSKRYAVILARAEAGRSVWSWRDGRRHKLVHPVEYVTDTPAPATLAKPAEQLRDECDAVDSDECAFLRERSVAGVSDTIPPCPTHPEYIGRQSPPMPRRPS